ncbi:MAG: ATPase, partial [Enterobacterales bacterium]|nr:ATPase [Enterobacterales bacterium]
VQIGGRIQWDYNHSELNGVTDEDDFNTRRARIYAKGNIGDDWSYKAQFNIGNNNGGTPEDLYITYGGWGKAAKVSIGNQRVVFGLEDFTSSNDITALERSGITEQYGVARQNSVRLHGQIGDAYYSVSAFEDDGAPSNDDFGLSGRVAYVPVKSDDMLIHVGAGFTQRGGDREAVGLEFAANFGAFHVQSEYFDESQAGTDRDGYYIQAGWLLTGETRPYKDGKFKRVKPNADSGAWEVFVRMEEGDGNHSDIELGRVDASAYTLGVNWYVANNVRLGMNYSDGDSNEAGSVDSGEEFRVRLQLTF